MNTRCLKTLLVAAFAATGFTSGAMAAETVGPVTDEIGVIKISKGEPIQIGTYYVISGPDTALGLDQQRAAAVAAKERGNMIAGHPVRFINEDTACNAEGGQNAATKLAANDKLVVVIGPACSSAATPGAPILWKAGIASVATSASAPVLTAPDRSSDYDGLVRTSINDIGQAKGDADWMYNVLGCRSAAAIHDGSPYAESLARLFAKNFAETWGGKVTSVEAIDPQTVDMRPVLNRIAADKPCVIYFPIFVSAAAQLVRQAPDVSGLQGTQLIAGSAVMTKDFISATGKNIVGLRFTYPDISSETYDMNRYPTFVKEYNEMFGEDPIQGFHTWAYDGANLAFDAIEKVAVTDDAGTTYIGRKALRDAMFATKDKAGLSGTISCGEHGDCKQFVFSAYQFTNSDSESFSPGTNPQKIYSGAWSDEKKAAGTKLMAETIEKSKGM